MKRKVLADGNGSNRVMIEGLGEYVAFVDFGLLQSSHAHKSRLLDSCEKALEERDQQIEKLKEQIEQASEFISNVSFHTEDKHAIHFVERAQAWLTK